MKTTFGLCIALFAVTLLAAEDKKKDTDKKDLEKLAGKWQPTSMQVGKAKLSDAQLKAITLTMEGDKYKVIAVEEKGPSPDKGSFKIDPKAKPMTMDIKGDEGPNKGKTFLCIYEVDGDSLKICYDLEGKKRPTEFKADSDKTLLATYKRVK